MLIHAWRLKYKIRRKKKKRKRASGYRQRKFSLSELGYSSYAEYLSSDDWKALRQEILSLYPVCLLCDNNSQQVHHMDYDAHVLLGIEKRLLVALCDGCHEGIEFDGKTKRSLQGTNHVLRALAQKTNRGRKFLRKLLFVENYRSENGIRLGPAFDHAARQRRKHRERNAQRKLEETR